MNRSFVLFLLLSTVQAAQGMAEDIDNLFVQRPVDDWTAEYWRHAGPEDGVELQTFDGIAITRVTPGNAEAWAVPFYCHSTAVNIILRAFDRVPQVTTANVKSAICSVFLARACGIKISGDRFVEVTDRFYELLCDVQDILQTQSRFVGVAPAASRTLFPVPGSAG